MRPSSSKDDPLVGQVVDERYRLRRRVGSGGMSVVYLAEQEGSGEKLAIKFLRSAFANLPDFVRRFEQEAKACSLLEHDNCVSVLGYGVAFGSPYLVMDYMGGKLLTEELSKGPLPVDRALAITRQILAGLRHAHERGVVHRDLKPGNIMLTRRGDNQIKIMDFGTAQLMTGEQGHPGRVGTEVGTPWYMAPEQAAGQPTDQRTDIYTVGVMLFEMLTGARPFTAEDPMRVLEMHLSSPIPSARALKPEIGLSPELEAAIVRAMQKQPDDRFASAHEFDSALAQVPELLPRRPSGSFPPVRRDELELPPEPARPAETADPAAPAETAAPEPVAPEPAAMMPDPVPVAEPTGEAPRKAFTIIMVLLTTVLAVGLLLLLLAQIGVVGCSCLS